MAPTRDCWVIKAELASFRGAPALLVKPTFDLPLVRSSTASDKNRAILASPTPSLNLSFSISKVRVVGSKMSKAPPSQLRDPEVHFLAVRPLININYSLSASV